jgi:hypothetical protein
MPVSARPPLRTQSPKKLSLTAGRKKTHWRSLRTVSCLSSKPVQRCGSYQANKFRRTCGGNKNTVQVALLPIQEESISRVAPRPGAPP